MDYELVIIGAGPAGYTAGIYASRAGIQCVIFEKNPLLKTIRVLGASLVLN